MSRRAPVQGECRRRFPDGYVRPEWPAGTITWEEHERVYRTYARLYGCAQTVERIAERGGFSFTEIIGLTGAAPATWEPR